MLGADAETALHEPLNGLAIVCSQIIHHWMGILGTEVHK